ncbi:MAG: VRR-NUC domain-containing protein [[Ruminococcus] torques]
MCERVYGKGSGHERKRSGKNISGRNPKLGGRAFKWVSPGNDGVPDRIVVLPGYPAVFVELKTITGRLTSLQRMQLKRLKEMGQAVRVLHGEHETGKLFLEECKDEIKRVTSLNRMGIKHTASTGLSRSKKSDYSWTWDSGRQSRP